jgi:hypothetical protein
MKLPFVCETNHYFPEVPATDYNVKIEVSRSLNVAVEIETTLAARSGKGLKNRHVLNYAYA